MQKPDSRATGVFAVVAIAALCLATISVWAVPAVLPSSTFALVVAFMIAGTTVSLLMWRNAQSTSTIAQVLHDTERAGRDSRPR